MTQQSCRICHTTEAVLNWNRADASRNIPAPPADLKGTPVCVRCFLAAGKDLIFRVRIRSRVCSIYGCDSEGYGYWTTSGNNNYGRYPSAPPDLNGAPICGYHWAYTEPTEIEMLVRKGLGLVGCSTVRPPVEMPNGQTGHICNKCNSFNAYVIPKDFPYVCTSCRQVM